MMSKLGKKLIAAAKEAIKQITAERINSTEFPRLKRIMNDPDFNTDTRHLPNDRSKDKLADK